MVTWSLVGDGSITRAGVYTVPNGIVGNTQVVVTATLVSNPYVTASYIMSLVYPVPTINGVSHPIPTGQPFPATIGGSLFTKSSGGQEAITCIRPQRSQQCRSKINSYLCY